MWFCPICANLLMVDGTLSSPSSSFICSTCPFKKSITSKRRNRIKLKNKTVDDVLGGAGAWENVDRTEAVCPECQHGEAFFMQIQIRSADEVRAVEGRSKERRQPATAFHRRLTDIDDPTDTHTH
jgi:DNA-directed RNA polymerase III subunit RPC11